MDLFPRYITRSMQFVQPFKNLVAQPLLAVGIHGITTERQGVG